MRTLAAVLVLASSAWADTIQLSNGGVLEGVIVREGDDGYVVRLKYATVTLAKDEVASVVKKAPAPAAAASRLPRWDRCVEIVGGKAWGGPIRQVPALVVEEGPLANVPYQSWRSGDYEFNLYGDPDAPAGIEIGVYKDLLKDEGAKRRCVETLAELLGTAADRDLVKALPLAGGKQVREGFTFEVTPETAPDAYGGWWVTAWDDAAISKARASQEELDRITATREEMEELARKAKEEDAKRKADLKKAEADARKAEAEARKAEAEAQKASATAPPPSSSSTYEEDWVTGTYLWRGYAPGTIRPPRPVVRPRPVPLPAKPRYYRPGYSRPAGGYRGGPRMGR